MDQQTRLLGRLLRIITETPEFSHAQPGDELIGLPADDGITLVFFGDPIAPVRCATEITRALHTYPELKLRIGLHSGPVYRMAGIDARASVAGEGIKTAQRIMSCGDAGHILISRPVADTLSQLSNWSNCFYDLGERETTSGARLQLFNLYTGEVGNPDLPAKLSATPLSSRTSATVAAAAASAATVRPGPEAKTQQPAAVPKPERVPLTTLQPASKTGAATRWVAGGVIALIIVAVIAAVLLRRTTTGDSQVAPGVTATDSKPANGTSVATTTSGARPLKSYEFDVVTVDARGTPTSGRGQARYFTEDLGAGVTLDMVEIPAGSFRMGSPQSEKERFGEEGPQRNVTVPAFYMGKHEVTQSQWRAVASLSKVNMDLKPSPSIFASVDGPVENVSWEEAVEFCDRLSQKTGAKWRLPSEAEWEYACRARTTTPFYYGDNINSELANYDGQLPYADGPKGEYRNHPTDVEKIGYANDFGLKGMHGNVWEWCQDTWHDDYRDAPQDAKAWVGGGSQRIIRGGAWNSPANNCRSAYRKTERKERKLSVIGFRVVMISASEIPKQQ